MIEIVTTFNDGHTRYYAGECVSENNFQTEDLKKFLEYGWAKEQGAEGAALQQGVGVTLGIHDGQIGHKTEVI